MKKILSFLFPVRLNTYATQYNGELAVNLLDGKKILDTAVSNYSYGSLQRTLLKALKQLPFDPSTKNILVLGMGAGSVVETIRKELNSNAAIVLIEIDPVVIEIAEKEFALRNFENITIIEADAPVFIAENEQLFDLVIVDLFIIDTVPVSCTTDDFIRGLAKTMTQNGRLIFNTLADTMPVDVFGSILQTFTANGIKTGVLKKIERGNNIIIGRNMVS